jgi:uncharacterized protein involved in tellurium resistance
MANVVGRNTNLHIRISELRAVAMFLTYRLSYCAIKSLDKCALHLTPLFVNQQRIKPEMPTFSHRNLVKIARLQASSNKGRNAPVYTSHF